MSTSIGKPVTAALLCVGALSFIAAAPAAVRIVAGIVWVLYLPGLAFLLALGDRRRPSLDYVYLPFLFSPVIGALLALACFLATGSVDSAWTAAPVAPAILVLASLFAKRREEPPRPSPVPRAILVISGAFAGIIVAAYLANAFLLYRADGWYHIAIANEIANRGIPPREPGLADEPIRYMWIYHFFIAGFRKFSGLPAAWAMGLFNAVNAFVFPYLVARMTALFRGERRFVLGTPLFAVASLSSASWILWPVTLGRALFGEASGPAEIARMAGEINIDGFQVMYFLTPFGLWMVNLVVKFCVITAFNYVLNLFLLCFVAIVSVDRRVRFDRGALAAAFCALLGTLLFHVIVGVSLVAAAAGAGALLLVARFAWPGRGEDFGPFHTIAVPVAAAAAAAAAFPYILSLMGHAAGEGSASRFLHPGIRNLLTIAAPLLILYPFTRAAFRDLRASDGGARRILAMWLVVLGVLNLFVDLPASNESKFVLPFLLLLTPLVAWQIIEALHRARGARLAWLGLVVAVLFAVPVALTVRGFFLEKPVHPIEVRRMSVTPDERELFAWIAANTPSGAVVMEGNTYFWMPVYGQRRSFFPDEFTISILGYDADRRIGRLREVRDGIYSAAPLREDDLAVLGGMKPDLYLVVWREDRDRIPGIEGKLTGAPDRFARVYGNPAGAVFKFVRR